MQNSGHRPHKQAVGRLPPPLQVRPRLSLPLPPPDRRNYSQGLEVVQGGHGMRRAPQGLLRR